jgi:signal transduction histidine kinase
MSDRTELEQQRVAMLEAELAARRLAEQAQSQLAEQNERLRKIDEARNQFLAIVSHELRTPLTSIVSFSELIRGEAEGLTPDGIRFLDIIERNADRLHRLVGDLLMLDRLSDG